MITLKDLESAGAVLSAGWVDYYNPAACEHVRIALVTTEGDLVWVPGGEDYANRLVVHNVLAVMDAPVVEVPVAEVPVAEVPPAPAEPAP